MKIDLFGREIEVRRLCDEWRVYYPGNDGVKRPASDVVIPSGVAEEALLEYLADIYHEYASAKHPDVRRME